MSNNSTKKQPVETAETKTPEPTEPTKALKAVEPEVKRWNVGNIFWGLMLIFIGTLVLIDNLNVVNVNFADLWQLWPIFIIGAGVSMLSLRGWIAGIVMFLLTAAMLTLAAFTAIDNPYFNPSPELKSQTVNIPAETTSSPVKSLDVSIKAGAAELNLASEANQKDVKAVFESTHMTLRSTNDIRGETRYVVLESQSDRQLWLGSIRNKLSLDLNQSLPLTLRIDAGASSINGDLSETKLSNLTIKAGASSIDLKFGNLQNKQEISLDSGASSVKLRVPSDAGVRVYSEGGLNSINFDSIDKKSDGLYESAGFDAATTQITIRAKLGASSFEIDRY